MSYAERTLKILKAVDDPVFFLTDEYFLGIKPYPKQQEVFLEFYKSEAMELILIVGRGGGKTTLAAMFALFEIFKLLILPDPAAHYGLIPGTPIFVMTVAVSEEQAHDTIYSRIVALIKNSPFFKEENPKIYKNEIRFVSKNVHIMCGHSSSASLVGRDVKVVINEELSKWEETTSKRGAWNVYNSVKQSSVSRFKDKATVISITSPRHENDIGMTLLAMSKETPNMLGFQYPTWVFNPNITFKDLEGEMKKDPAAFWTDYGAEPIESIAPYMPEHVLRFDSGIPNYLALIAQGKEPKIEPGYYVLAGDPALRNDAFGFALARKDRDNYVICGLHRFVPRKLSKRETMDIDLKKVREFISNVIKLARLRFVVFDTWFIPQIHEAIKQEGVPVIDHMIKREDYDVFKELCYFEKISMCPYPMAAKEFKELRIINNRKVDHPKGGSKDVADAIVNSVGRCVPRS